MPKNEWWETEVPGINGGPDLHPYGPHHWDADYIFFVCFASQIIYSFKTETARTLIELRTIANTKPGSGNGNNKLSTGLGLLLTPKELGAQEHAFCPNPKYDNWSLSQRAVMAVRDYLASQRWSVGTRVLVASDIAGTDLCATRQNDSIRVQVKSRRKRWPKLFIQTHEANPEKIYQ